MSFTIAIMVFVLFSSGLYLLMRRHVFEVLLGVLILSHGTHLLMISMGGWGAEEGPPLLSKDKAPLEAYADPLPQALILTAIVISFGVAAFLIVMIARGVEETGSTEFGELGKEEDEA